MLREFKEEFRIVFANLDRLIKAAVLILVGLYLASGVYIVEANEAGVLLRFGKLWPETIKPGIHYRLPWPVDNVKTVSIRQVKRMEAGFWPGDPSAEITELLSYCVTGDKNIIHTHYIIQYRIGDPAAYLFGSIDPERTMRKTADSIILHEIAFRAVDPVLTSAKQEIEIAIRDKLQKAVKERGLGITVENVETREIKPPSMVIDSFKEVTDAKEEKSTLTHRAQEQSYRIISNAEGEAQKIIQEAKAYKFQRINSAEGESKRFLSLYREYEKAPETTRRRLFIDMVEKMLPKVKLYVLATDEKGRPTRIKLIRGAVPTRPILDLGD